MVNDKNEKNAIGEIECTDDNINIAGMIDEDPNSPYYKHFVGYPGGQCGFVRDEESCDMESMVDWLEVYYCDVQESFCSKGKGYIMLPIALFTIVVAMWNLGSTAD